jgi:excisionase family DNA binding protein
MALSEPERAPGAAQEDAPRSQRPVPLSVKQAAKRLGVSKSLIYALIASGRLRHYRVGVRRGTIRVEEDALEEVKKVTAAKADESLAAGLKHLTLH